MTPAWKSNRRNLPVTYLEWFQREGWPKGEAGMLLATMYEIRLNGLEKLLDPLKKAQGQF